MKISKGTVKNINNKLIASILTLSLTTTLAGCSLSFIDTVNYTKDEKGYINGIDGIVKRQVLDGSSFVKVCNNMTDETYYTIGVTDDWDGNTYDLFTKQNLSDTEAFEVDYFDNLNTWINALGTSKDEYSEEELRELLNIFIEKQEEKDKQLVKE